MNKKYYIFIFLVIFLISVNEALAKNTHYSNGKPVRELEVQYENGEKIIKERISGGSWKVISRTPIEDNNSPEAVIMENNNTSIDESAPILDNEYTELNQAPTEAVSDNLDNPVKIDFPTKNVDLPVEISNELQQLDENNDYLFEEENLIVQEEIAKEEKNNWYKIITKKIASFWGFLRQLY